MLRAFLPTSLLSASTIAFCVAQKQPSPNQTSVRGFCLWWVRVAAGAGPGAGGTAGLPKNEREAMAKMDSAGDDGGLMAEFNARLDQEGGANLFKMKTQAAAVSEGANDAAKAAKDKAEDLANAAGNLTSGLTEQQKNIGKIILGLIAFNLLIQALASAFSGGGASTYSV